MKLHTSLPDRIGGGVLSDGGKGFVAHRRDAPPCGLVAAEGTQLAKTHPAASTQAPTVRRVLPRVQRARGSRVAIADLLGTRNPFSDGGAASLRTSCSGRPSDPEWSRSGVVPRATVSSKDRLRLLNATPVDHSAGVASPGCQGLARPWRSGAARRGGGCTQGRLDSGLDGCFQRGTGGTAAGADPPNRTPPISAGHPLWASRSGARTPLSHAIAEENGSASSPGAEGCGGGGTPWAPVDRDGRLCLHSKGVPR